MPLLSRLRTVLAKIETTYGTDSSPTGAANAILLRNLSITPIESDLASRDLIRSYLGNSDQLVTAKHVVAEFEVELAGAGAAGTAPAYGPLLRACGMSETTVASTSVTYAPVSQNFESATIYMNVNGVLHKMLGARGTVSFDWTVKQIPVAKFKFTGLYVNVADAAAPTPTYTGFQKPLAVTPQASATFSILGYTGSLNQITADLNNTVVHHPVIGDESILITDRKASGKIQIEATTVATKDWWTNVINATTGSVSLTHGTTAGNKVQFSAPAVQLTKPAYTDLNGVQMLTFDAMFNPSSGNDEISLVVL